MRATRSGGQLTPLACGLGLLGLLAGRALAEDPPRQRLYENRLTPIANPGPLLADHPEFVEPIRETARFEAPTLVTDPGADLDVRAWRFSENARGVIEIPNRLRANQTAVIVVHPWGIDDGQGWKSPEPAGVAFGGTPEKNHLCLEHMARVVNPFLKALRGKVALVAYSLPGGPDPIRTKLYRSLHGQPSPAQRRQGARELAAKLHGFSYTGQPLPARLTVSTDKPVRDYFRQFPGSDATAQYNHAGFWELPIPVAKPLQVDPKDVVIFDAEGYGPLKAFLHKQGIRHILLTGYHADMCVCRTTAGYENLSKDFNVFLVGDATLATFPASETPRFATQATICLAAQDQLITQVSWVHYLGSQQARHGKAP